jgi:hypothetical protein
VFFYGAISDAGDALLGVKHRAADVAVADIDVDVGRKQRVLGANSGRGPLATTN